MPPSFDVEYFSSQSIPFSSKFIQTIQIQEENLESDKRSNSNISSLNRSIQRSIFFLISHSTYI